LINTLSLLGPPGLSRRGCTDPQQRADPAANGVFPTAIRWSHPNMLPRGRRLRRKADSAKSRSGNRDGHPGRSWRRLRHKTVPQPTWKARSFSSPSGCQLPAGSVPYRDRQIASRAGVTLRIIAARRLGHLENNQATVVCARRDGKNFPTARYKPRFARPLDVESGSSAALRK